MLLLHAILGGIAMAAGAVAKPAHCACWLLPVGTTNTFSPSGPYVNISVDCYTIHIANGVLEEHW